MEINLWEIFEKKLEKEEKSKAPKKAKTEVKSGKLSYKEKTVAAFRG